MGPTSAAAPWFDVIARAKPRVLVLYVVPNPRHERLTTLQHLAAVSRLEGSAEVLPYNALHGVPRWLRRLRFDAIVLHTTLLCQRWTPSFATWKRGLDWLAEDPAVKIAFPQDEYDHAHVLDDWLDELGASVVCTVLDERHRSELYPRLSPKATFYEVLTGYIDEEAGPFRRARMALPSYRTHDLVYRARNLPYWFGSHGQTKHLIGQAAAARARHHGLSFDISTRPQDAILGDAWLDFLSAGRGTIGTESGSSVLDARGEIQVRVRELLAEDPELSFDEVSRMMPAGWDDYRFVAISPRHLEAVATKTAQILVRGRYSGVLEEGRHYIPVEPDFSNLDEALEEFRRPGLAERIADQAYEDVYRGGRWSSSALSGILTAIVREHAPPRARGRRVPFALGAPVVRAHRDVEEKAVASASYVLRTGRGSTALLRLVAADPVARRLLSLYVASGPAREHVGPRDAIVDLLCVSRLRQVCTRRVAENAFCVEVGLDRAGRQLTFRSVAPHDRPCDSPASHDVVAELLCQGAWDFTWDHSAVAVQAHYPILGRLRTPLYFTAGVRDLATLHWLAQERPRDIAGALAPVLD